MLLAAFLAFLLDFLLRAFWRLQASC